MSKIVLLSIDGFGMGQMPDAKENANTWKSVCKASKESDFPFLKKIMNKSTKVSLDYTGADSYLGHLTMSGIKTKHLSLKPLSYYKNAIISLLSNMGMNYYEYKGMLIINDALIIYDNFEADHGLAINIAGCEDVFSFNEQLKFSEKIRKIIENPRLISFTAKNVKIDDYKNVAISDKEFHGILTPKSGVYNETFKVKHFPLITDFKSSIQSFALSKLYKVYLYGKFANIININKENVYKFSEINPDKSFDSLFKNIENNTFHCINIQQTDLAGHESNIKKYINTLNEIDINIEKLYNSNDIKFILTSDHGNDPSLPGGKHNREYVPLIVNFANPLSGKISLSQVSDVIKNIIN